MWHSGDYDGLQSQRSGVQIQVSAKKKKKLGGGFRSKDRVRVRGVNGARGRARGRVGGVDRVRDRDGVGCNVRNRDGVRAGSGCAVLFEKHPPPPKKVENYLVGKN